MTTIQVGNLSYETTASDIQAIFSPFGEIDRVDLLMDAQSRSKGIALVYMPQDAQAERAIFQVDGRSFNGRPLYVTESKMGRSFVRNKRETGPPRRRH